MNIFTYHIYPLNAEIAGAGLAAGCLLVFLAKLTEATKRRLREKGQGWTACPVCGKRAYTDGAGHYGCLNCKVRKKKADIAAREATMNATLDEIKRDRDAGIISMEEYRRKSLSVIKHRNKP